ncbi:MAG: ATP-binding protein [Gammaproteobacteria bacterium]|nr:ATP-binding protein [Gammaproteobacteria bacterium]
MSNDDTDLATENQRLKKINAALISRVEAGHNESQAYDSFAHSVYLADQVRERTAALNTALNQLQQTNHKLILAQQSAEQANQSKSKLMAAIGHDLMQPICATRLIAGALKEAQTHSLNEPNIQKKLRAIDTAMVDMEDLLDSLLHFAKLESNDIEATVTIFDAANLLEQLAIESQYLAQEKGLNCRIHIPHCQLEGDIRLLTRVLRNLISNAIKFTDQGSILIGCRTRRDGLEIQIWDTGCGIEDQYLETIFDEFTQLPNRTNSQGLGLGLANVKKLCRAMGTAIKVRSQVGKGSCFSLTLPYATSPAKTATSDLPYQHLKQCQIVVIDNDTSVRNALTDLISSWGAKVRSSATGLDLKPEIIQQADAFVLDYHLDKNTTGLDIFTRVISPNSHSPVLMITANRDEELAKQLATSEHQLLYKPIRPAKLRSALTSLVAHQAR